jgi:hypothetical protein
VTQNLILHIPSVWNVLREFIPIPISLPLCMGSFDLHIHLHQVTQPVTKSSSTKCTETYTIQICVYTCTYISINKYIQHIYLHIHEHIIYIFITRNQLNIYTQMSFYMNVYVYVCTYFKHMNNSINVREFI